MSIDDLEQTLRNLPNVGTLVKDREYRQVWRFEHAGKAYYLKFYPRGGPRDLFRRFFRGSPAMREFARLKALQRADIPAPRAVAAMVGFNLSERRGDAVILEAIEPSIPLDQYLHNYEIRGEVAPDHLNLSTQVRELVHKLGAARLGHADLHLGNFLLQDGKLFLLDAIAVRLGGLRQRDVLMLGHSARRYATTTDLLRGWYRLGTDAPIPPVNSHSQFLWKRFMESVTRENRYFGRIHSNGWSGLFFKQMKHSYRWSAASALEISREDWQTQWPMLLAQIESDSLPVVKRSRSGDVLLATITVAGRALDVVVKRPKRRYWYRYLNEIGRGSRPRRAWKKAWHMIARGLPTAWPLLMMEHRKGGYVVDALFICERVNGATLAHADLDAIEPALRELLLRRAGRMLRDIERQGFAHFDAKASNWIVLDDAKTGPRPVMIDTDGIRHRRWIALGIERLLRSMHENPHYSIPDSLSLCLGYAPYARLADLATEPAEEAPQLTDIQE